MSLFPVGFQMRMARNYALEPVVVNLGSVATKDTEMQIPPFQLNDFLPKDVAKRDQFFEYQGSLPYPPCNPGVSWTVMAAVSTVGEDQVRVLQVLYSQGS